MISLRCETQPSPSANGVASFYFGSSHGSVSTIGRNLADFIQREVVARTGLRDCRTHGRTWDLLRLTRMPTVQVDVGYITNPRDRSMLVTSHARDAIRRRASWPPSNGSTCWARTTVPPVLSRSPSCSPTSCRSNRPARFLTSREPPRRRRPAAAAVHFPAAAPARPRLRLSSPTPCPVRAAAAGSTDAARRP